MLELGGELSVLLLDTHFLPEKIWMLELGGELSFFTPRYSFPARKKMWDKTQNTEAS
jgi:hypothetical protein